MSSISLRTGTEGPRHDPYSFDELTVRVGKRKPVTVHLGLDTWLKVGSRRMAARTDEGIALAFEVQTGMTITAAKRALRKAEEARHRAHHYHGGMEWGRGFPGESLLICKCGAVIDYHFDRSAIE